MDELEQFVQLLQACASTAKRLDALLQEDKASGKQGLSGEVERLYRERCDQAAEKLKDIRSRIAVLISESSAGLI